MRCFTLSNALVASSNSRMAGLFTKARAIRIRCRCPPLMPPPASLIRVNIFMGISAISSAHPAKRAASQASSRVLHGAVIVILLKISPEKSLPFCKHVPMRRRRLRLSTLLKSYWS